MYRSAMAWVLACGAGLGQTTFEVASVKPAAPATGHQQYYMTVNSSPAGVEYLNASLVDLVHTAYRVNAWQVQGPEWMRTEKFDVVAKLPAGASRERLPEMLQALLAERFKLAVHRATQTLAAYALVVRKGAANPAPAANAERSNWSRSFGPDGSMHMDTRGITMAALADLISSFVGAAVIDRTALAGEYDVPIDFSPQDVSTGSRSAGVMDSGNGGDGGSSVAGSLKRSGLGLEAQKAALEVIVVDHVERRPTEN